MNTFSNLKTQTITRIVELPFNKLDYNIYKTLDKITDSFINKCSQEIGYIVNITNRKYDKPIITPSTSNILVTCHLTVDYILPQINEVYEAKCVSTITEGLLVVVYGLFKVFVMSDDKKYKVGDKIVIRIDEIKYDTEFKCIGSIYNVT